jgi:hypothetical protein
MKVRFWLFEPFRPCLAFKTEDNVPAVSYKKNYFFGIIKSPKKGVSRIPKHCRKRKPKIPVVVWEWEKRKEITHSPHFDDFGSFLRRITFALASTYLPLGL